MTVICGNAEFSRKVGRLVGDKLGFGDFGPNVAGFLVESRGELAAAAVFHSFMEGRYTAISFSLWSATPRWVTRGNVSALFSYPFVQLGCGRVQAVTSINNRRARKCLLRLGFREECGRMKNAWTLGGDASLYAMTPDECRWIIPARKSEVA